MYGNSLKGVHAVPDSLGAAMHRPEFCGAVDRYAATDDEAYRSLCDKRVGNEPHMT